MRLILVFFVLFSLNSFSQEDSVYTIVDVEPQFPGGEVAMMSFIMDNFEYPQGVSACVQGIFYMQFIIEKNGSVSNVKCLKCIQEDYNNAVIDSIEKMPLWEPGELNSKKVRVRYTLPVCLYPR